MDGEQRDSPLEVVESCRARHRAGGRGPWNSRPVDPPWPFHELPTRSSKLSVYQFLGSRSVALGHRVEAHGSHALRWELRVEARLLHLLGHALRRTRRPRSATRTESTTSSPPAWSSVCKPSQPAQVGAEGENADVGLVAQHGRRHDLVVVLAGPCSDRLEQRAGIYLAAGLAEQVEHSPTRGRARGRSLSHGAPWSRQRAERSWPGVYGRRVRAGTAWAGRSNRRARDVPPETPGVPGGPVRLTPRCPRAPRPVLAPCNVSDQ